MGQIWIEYTREFDERIY